MWDVGYTACQLDVYVSVNAIAAAVDKLINEFRRSTAQTRLLFRTTHVAGDGRIDEVSFVRQTFCYVRQNVGRYGAGVNEFAVGHGINVRLLACRLSNTEQNIGECRVCARSTVYSVRMLPEEAAYTTLNRETATDRQQSKL